MLLDDNPSPPTEPYNFALISGSFEMVDSIGAFNPRTGGGISPSEHRELDQLVHEVAESCYYEPTYSGWRIVSESWWTDSSKTTLIRKIDYTYSGWRVTTETIRQYDASGAVVETLTGTYTYSGWQVVSIDWSLT